LRFSGCFRFLAWLVTVLASAPPAVASGLLQLSFVTLAQTSSYATATGDPRGPRWESTAQHIKNTASQNVQLALTCRRTNSREKIVKISVTHLRIV